MIQLLKCFTHFWKEKLQNIEDSSLVMLGCQLLPLATSKLIGDNGEFDYSAIF